MRKPFYKLSNIITMAKIEERLNAVEQAVKMAGLTTKEILTFEEASLYMGFSKSYLYKLTAKCKVPHYKPLGKMCYFNRLELDQWLQSNRVTPTEEIQNKAQAYCMRKRL